MAVLANDTCTRPDQTGFGTASDGQDWSMAGASVATSISSNEATFNHSVDFAYGLLGTKTTSDINMLVRIEQDDGGTGIGPFFRYSDPSNLYFIAFFFSQFQAYKMVGGALTQLASVVPVGYLTGNYWWCRVSMSGAHLQARAWADGGSEPGTWLIDTTDSQFAGPGRFGMSVNGGGGLVRFDHLTVTDNQVDIINVNASLIARAGQAMLTARKGSGTVYARKGNATLYVRE